MKLYAALSVFFLLNCSSALAAGEEQLQLQLVQVLFTHGDRTPVASEIYENDPYESVFERIGYGKLTKTGAQRARKLGETLRKRYDDFLDADLRDDDVYARSTDVNYTKASLRQVLAGLTNATVRARYEAKESDFLYSHMLCPKYQEMIRARVNERIERMNVDQAFLDHIRESTGIDSADRVHTLYDNLRSALSLGLPLPDWCSQEDFEQIKKFAESYYSAITDTLIMMKLNAGEIIEQFLKNINSSRKIYLYGAHDFSVAGFTNVHNYEGAPRLPEYGSAVVVETLRGDKGNAYVRSFLWTGVSEQWIPLELQVCGRVCSLTDYRILIDWVLPYGQIEEVCGAGSASQE